MRRLARMSLIACIVLELGAAGCHGRARPCASSAEPRERALAHLFAARAVGAAGCRHGFVTAPGVDRACFRACRSASDCPAGADCRAVEALGDATLCYAR
jgi:hypothetical protein